VTISAISLVIRVNSQIALAFYCFSLYCIEQNRLMMMMMIFIYIYIEYISRLISINDDDGYGVNVYFRKTINFMLLKVLFIVFLSYQTSKVTRQ